LVKILEAVNSNLDNFREALCQAIKASILSRHSNKINSKIPLIQDKIKEDSWEEIKDSMLNNLFRKMIFNKTNSKTHSIKAKIKVDF
jgi:hypothetical protein